MKFDIIIEYIAVILTILASYLVSRDFTSISKLTFIAANLLWLYIGYKWNKFPLIVMSIIMLIIYISGAY